MANKMVERLASPRVDAETFPMLMAATTSPQGESHTQLKQLRNKFEDRETEIIHELYEVHFKPRGSPTHLETTKTLKQEGNEDSPDLKDPPMTEEKEHFT